MYLTKIQNNFVSHGKNTYFCAQKGMPKECFIGLGSNENTASNMISAQKDLLRFFPDIRFSSLLQTRPIGFCSPNPFFNMTAVCTTSLPLTGIRQLLKQIEMALGRKPEDKAHGIVKIDLDLLAYDGQILKPEDWKRSYVREGVNELSQTKPPANIHPHKAR